MKLNHFLFLTLIILQLFIGNSIIVSLRVPRIVIFRLIIHWFVKYYPENVSVIELDVYHRTLLQSLALLRRRFLQPRFSPFSSSWIHSSRAFPSATCLPFAFILPRKITIVKFLTINIGHNVARMFLFFQLFAIMQQVI